MLWVIYYIAVPHAEQLRKKELVEAHRVYLRSQKDILVLAAPMVRDDSSNFLGTMRVVHVNSRAEAEAFSDGDPFVKAGLFVSITITRARKGQWNPGAAEGA